MSKQFTAIYKKTGAWYSGWVEEVPGVNTQGKTMKEVRENLQKALFLVLETNKIATKDYSKGRGKTLKSLKDLR